MLVFLLVHLAFAVNGQHQVLRQCVDNRDANAVQATRYLVGVVIEFTAGVKNRHDDFGGRAPLLRVHVHRNATPIVGDRHRFVGMNRDRNRAAVARQRLVDRVVDNLENHVVQARAIVGIADVHAGPLANGLKAL